MVGSRNLATERGPSVWDKDDKQARVGQRNRWAGGLGGVAVAAAGAALVAYGGRRAFRALAGPARASTTPSTWVESERDLVGDESSDSFPASDSPSWTPVGGIAARER